MSEPMRKRKQVPESYTPKVPEIASMMQEHAGHADIRKADTVKTASGGSYVDGVPMLKWGEWKDNSYCGCVTALLHAAGIPVSYEDVMGWSGVCYQAIMRDDWDPSSQMPQNGKLCERNVGDALGIAVYTLNDDQEIGKRAQHSIDNGFPVLLVGGRWAPEWTLACGYEIANSEARFYGRTYFDCQHHAIPEKVIEQQTTHVPDNEIFTANNYLLLSGFPGWFPTALTRFYDKPCEPISRKQALRVSLETCIAMFEQQPGEHHRFGYGAYDVLIAGFTLDDAEYQAQCGGDQYHIGSLQDARRAAYVYLDGSAGLLVGANQVKLTEAAQCYRAMLDNLLAAVPYNMTTAVFNSNAKPIWNATQRQALVAALRMNKTLEQQARVLVADILEHWEA